jgi:hypothetical protein
VIDRFFNLSMTPLRGNLQDVPSGAARAVSKAGKGDRAKPEPEIAKARKRANY